MIVLGETPALAKPKPPAAGRPAPAEIVFAVQQFLYRESRLLAEERYEEWLGLMTPDIRYWMPGVQARYRKDRRPRYAEDRMAHFDDDLLNLRRRVTRFKQETAWGEDPPTRVCHVISNVEAELTDKPDEYDAYSNFINVRGRNEDEENWLAGRRKDRLRRDADGTLRLAAREVYITQTVLLAKNLNVFL